jgi:hypothetical protein
MFVLQGDRLISTSSSAPFYSLSPLSSQDLIIRRIGSGSGQVRFGPLVFSSACARPDPTIGPDFSVRARPGTWSGWVKPDFSCVIFGSGFFGFRVKMRPLPSLTFMVGQKFQPEPGPYIRRVGQPMIRSNLPPSPTRLSHGDCNYVQFDICWGWVNNEKYFGSHVSLFDTRFGPC